MDFYFIMHTSRPVIWGFRESHPEPTQLKIHNFSRSHALYLKSIWEGISCVHVLKMPPSLPSLAKVSPDLSQRLAYETP